MEAEWKKLNYSDMIEDRGCKWRRKVGLVVVKVKGQRDA